MFGFPMRITMNDGRIILMRPMIAEEMTEVSSQISRYEICKHLSLNGAQSPEQEQAWLNNKYSDSSSVGWGVALAEGPEDTTGRLIGSSGIEGIANHRGESGVVLWDSTLWGGGIATAIHSARCWYSVNCHHLVAIDSGADQANIGSIRALKRVGYVQSGVDYNRGYANGKICHGVKLLWVNPIEHVWNYFWADSIPPKQFIKGRKRAQYALSWADSHVTLL